MSLKTIKKKIKTIYFLDNILFVRFVKKSKTKI